MSDEHGSEAAGDDLQQAARDLVAGYEDERRRAARLLHDRVGQALGSVVLNLELCGDVPLDAELRSELVAELRGAIAELRDLSLSLRPALLDDCGLAEALRALAQRLAGSHGRAIRVEASAGPTAGGGAAGILGYRFAQAALEAGLTCAGAGPLVLQVDGEPALLCLRLEGTAVAASAPALDARARLFGGRCVARDADAIEIVLPVG